MSNFKLFIQEAVKIAGTQKALADGIGISQQGVSYLLTDAKDCSPEIAAAIDRFTQGKISKSDLRPDIWESAA